MARNGSRLRVPRGLGVCAHERDAPPADKGKNVKRQKRETKVETEENVGKRRKGGKTPENVGKRRFPTFSSKEMNGEMNWEM
jgi:hypothetical protein